MGIRVHIFPDGGVKIYARNKAAADKVMEYLLDEGLLVDIFKSKRNIEE